MALDGIICGLLTDELNFELSGQRIDKIYMPDRHTCILHIRMQTCVRRLLISIDPSLPRVGLTSSCRDNPAMPPSFCMLLRKYLSGSHIEKVTNPGYERIIEFHIVNTDELHDSKRYRLIAELMGRFSNLILVNEFGKIIDSAIHVDCSVSRVREVMPARIYEYSPSQDKLTPAVIIDMCRSSVIPVKDDEKARPVDKALVNSIKGISPLISRQLCHKAGVDDRKTVLMLTEAETSSLIRECLTLFEEIGNKSYTPRVYYGEDGEPAEYSVMKLDGYESFREFSSISEAIDSYYEERDRLIDIVEKKHRLIQIVSSAIARIMKKKEIHEKDLSEGLKADKYKLFGDLILTYKYQIRPGDKSVTVMNYESNPPEDITIELDPTLDAIANSQDFYRRFRKAKRKYEMADSYIRDDELGLAYLRSIKTAIDAADSDEDLSALDEEIRSEITSGSGTRAKTVSPKGDPNRMVGTAKSGKASSRALREAAKNAGAAKNRQSRQSKALSFRRFVTKDGYEILSGRNNIQNDQLTFSTASRSDWWFHIKGLPGTHVILKLHPGEQVPSDESVIAAAQLAAFFSKSTILEEHLEGKGSSSGAIKAEVDYCPVSHVKKIPGAKPGMVIYKEHYSILVDAKVPAVQSF